MSTKLLVDESKYQQLRRDLRYSGLRYIKFWFISMIVNSLAALNFYFIEHCFTAVQRLPTVSENLFQSACDLVNEYRQYNESITLLENKLNKLCEQEIGRMLSARTRKCQLSNLVFAEWFDYAYVVSLTIGKRSIRLTLDITNLQSEWKSSLLYQEDFKKSLIRLVN